MSDMSLLPVGSGMGSDALAAAGGAFVGGLFGNWFGNGFGGNGWGGRGGYPAEAAVVAQGAADTVILDNLINELQTQLCDSNSRIATLESNAFTTASNAAQTQQIINTILPHILTKSTTA